MSTNPFKALLQSSKNLVEDTNRNDTHSIQRELSQIANESHLLKTKLTTDQAHNTSGHYLLAQSGINAQQIDQLLKTLSKKTLFESTDQTDTTDIESFLSKIQTNIVIETVAEGRQNTREDIEDALDTDLEVKWKNAQRRILENWEQEQENKVFGHRLKGTDENTAQFKKRVVDYSSVIKELNRKRLLSEKYPVTKKIREVPNAGYTKTQEVCMNDSWNIVSFLNKETSGGDRIQHAKITQNKHDILRQSKSLIQQSLHWLESEYMKYINDTLYKNVLDAKLGGIPSTAHKINSFIQIVFKKNQQWLQPDLEISNDVPIWVYIYITLRSGHPDLALKYITDHKQYFHKSSEFPSILSEYLTSPDRIISDDSRRLILVQYQQMKYGNIPFDPYKCLLYKMIGRCELHLTDIAPIIRTTEDYVWLQMNLVRENMDEEGHRDEQYRLVDFQDILVKAGPKHFDPNGLNPWYYFKILLLSLQFEKAINFLYKTDKFRLEAVHLAIVFAYYGLLRIPDEPRTNTYDLLILDRQGRTSLNFGYLINQYVRMFLSDDPDNALQYFYLLTLYSNIEGPTVDDMTILSREYICSYVTGIQDYKAILGYKSNAERHPGSLDTYKSLIGIDNSKDTYRDVILHPMAIEFCNQGKYKDAVSIYELSGAYNEALTVLNNQLDYALYRPQPDESLEDRESRREMDDELIRFSLSTLRNYQNDVHIVHLINTEIQLTHHILLQLLEACIRYEKNELDQALELIRSTKLIPMENEYLVIQQHITQFSQYDELIQKHIPSIMSMTVDILYKLWEYYSSLAIGHRQAYIQLITNLRNAVDSVAAFAGLLQFKIPSDILEKINRTTIMMVTKI
ncbi:Nup93/Nic96-domain-containing protein [Pilobolus umbonatus]|nr:Nup93/Nic96-domain-containing protein [Pilobolus umbonatus]